MLDTGLNWFLETNAALATLLGRGGSPACVRGDKTSGIFPVAASGIPTLPYIVTLQISDTPVNVMEGVNRFQTARYRFFCHGSNFTNAKRLANTLKLQIQGVIGTWYSLDDGSAQVAVKNVTLAAWSDNAEPDAHNTIFTSMIDFAINFVDLQ